MYLKIEDIFSIMNLEVDLISVCQPFTTLAIANSCMKSRESASLLHTYLGCVGVDVHRFHFLLGSELNLFLS